MIDDSPNTVSSSVAGPAYTGSAWLKVPSGRSVTVRLREYRGSTLVRYRPGWPRVPAAGQQLSVTSAPADGSTAVSIDVVVSLTTSLKAQVDDVALRRG